MTALSEHLPAQQEGIVFIPDISGFTQFVHDTDIRLGSRITNELLGKIVGANALGLKISEIEGDAILFYRYGAPPSLAQLIDQYEAMLIAFKKKIRELHHQYALRDLNLSLKLIVHFGPISEYSLSGYKKLYGETIVQAHQLLKNTIPCHNYILVTKNTFDQMNPEEVKQTVLPEWIQKERKAFVKSGPDDLHFSYFLYDTELLKINTLNKEKPPLL